ncbi:hypothetical protein [Nocardioides bizhenqiangii]|uniref:Uncharacterized protein n=1 Tax=Nocardioides bizhenqiangii TaxID=3095076 RepID=A0ABZ0ZUG2_9ACTN|nr:MULTISPECIES: hypothetical protein [unclassified Nocardioides]MDZ5622952.1 hypothetical protein [Nocardioides sp. HM23]WQQ27935.1 hypothetical protein SHK19_06785 [Nocardioides sp. HM61]
MRHLVRLGHAISDWPVASQQQARRNAMVALTACADRRAEREDVASYLAERATRSDRPAAVATPGPRAAARA